MYSTFVFNPIYNALVYLVGILPGGDVGLAVIVLTLALRLLLLPLSQKAYKTQVAMRTLQPQLDALKEKYKHDPREYMREVRKIYAAAGVSPFASIVMLLVQIPVLFGLYQVFTYGHLATPDVNLLYPFVAVPAAVGTLFLGFIDMYSRSAFLALLAGVTQYWLAMVMPPVPASTQKSFANDFAASMQVQMKYVFPVLVAIFSYGTSAAIALYLIVSNLASIAQEVYNKRAKT